MSKIYKIHRWDSVLFKTNTDPVPIVYIKPDDDLISYANKNNNILAVELHSPNSIYNNKKVTGKLYKSSEIPNFRPEFFKVTGLYVVILVAPWHGYPDSLGDISIFVNKNVNTEIQPTNIKKRKEKKLNVSTPSKPSITPQNGNNDINNIITIGIIASMLVFIISIYIIVKM